MSHPHEMSNAELLLTIGQILERLKQPDPDADVNRLLESLPMGCATITPLLGALAIRAASITLDIAGVDIEAGPVTVELVANMPADDIPGFAKTAGELARLGCDFMIATGAAEERASRALSEAAHAAAHQGPEFANLVLSELVGRIRRLQHGDTREVITG